MQERILVRNGAAVHTPKGLHQLFVCLVIVGEAPEHAGNLVRTELLVRDDIPVIIEVAQNTVNS